MSRTLDVPFRLSSRLLLPFAVLAYAQTPPAPKNPLEVNATNAERGHHFFYSNCGICHGFNAQGGDKGPRLNGSEFRHGGSDAELFRTITQGISGTIMPGSALSPDEVWAIVVYLRSKVTADRAGVQGDAKAGEKTFESDGRCAQCHMVKGSGGVLGPDLSRIGGARSVQYLMEKIRNPGKDLSTGLREPNADYIVPISNSTVTVVTNTGQRISGVPRNEDTFSVQMLGTDNELHVFLKRDLKEVINKQDSLMPAYSTQMLSEGDLSNLIAYLATLK